jgi:hypothetical protein
MACDPDLAWPCSARLPAYELGMVIEAAIDWTRAAKITLPSFAVSGGLTVFWPRAARIGPDHNELR